MTKKKIVFLNKNNMVVATTVFDQDDILEAGEYAALLSNPEFFEVEYDSPVTNGWRYVNGKATQA